MEFFGNYLIFRSILIFFKIKSKNTEKSKNKKHKKLKIEKYRNYFFNILSMMDFLEIN